MFKGLDTVFLRLIFCDGDAVFVMITKLTALLSLLRPQKAWKTLSLGILRYAPLWSGGGYSPSDLNCDYSSRSTWRLDPGSFPLDFCDNFWNKTLLIHSSKGTAFRTLYKNSKWPKGIGLASTLVRFPSAQQIHLWQGEASYPAKQGDHPFFTGSLSTKLS